VTQLIAHVVHGFSVGGLENGLVNLVNRMPAACISSRASAWVTGACRSSTSPPGSSRSATRTAA
jgi:hypothetical protein